MVGCGEKDPVVLFGTGLSSSVSAVVCFRFFLLQQILARQVRQRSLPHHWQKKQSGQGCFFLFGLLSGT
jgi:hypothetical protein